MGNDKKKKPLHKLNTAGTGKRDRDEKNAQAMLERFKLRVANYRVCTYTSLQSQGIVLSVQQIQGLFSGTFWNLKKIFPNHSLLNPWIWRFNCTGIQTGRIILK